MQTSTPADHFSNLKQLKQTWLIISGVFLLSLLAGATLLRSSTDGLVAGQWLLQASAVVVIEMWLLWSALEKNRRSEFEPLLGKFGLGNFVTLARGVLIAMVAGFLFLPEFDGWLGWVPGILYTLAVIADYFDGFAARITNHSTTLGAFLDMEYDVLGMIVAPLLAVWYGRLPWWYLLVSVLRYAFVGVEWWYQKQGKPLREINDSMMRRLIAGCQMVFVFIVLVPVYKAPETHVAAAAIMLPVLISFGRDLLVMTGVVRVDGKVFAHIAQISKEWVFGHFALLLRLGCSGLLILLAAASMDTLSPLMLVGLGMSIVLLVAGILTRVTGIGVALLMGFIIPVVGLSMLTGLLLFMSLILLVTGGGTFTLWQPEDRFMLQRGGAAA